MLVQKIFSLIKHTQQIQQTTPIVYNFTQLDQPKMSVEQQKKQKEKLIADQLRSQLNATFVQVVDTSVEGACGTMYKFTIESNQFKELSKVEQHQLVTSILSEEIQGIHGFNLKTLIPKVEQVVPNTK